MDLNRNEKKLLKIKNAELSNLEIKIHPETTAIGAMDGIHPGGVS